MNKLKAFTILELTVVMLISMLVMGIAYQGYMLFYKQFLSFKTNSEKIADVSLLDRLIWTDMADSKTVLRNSKGIECLFSEKTIVYEWEEKYILRRDASMTDTFYLSTGAHTFNLLGRQVSDGELVDEVIFTDAENEPKTFHYFKKYGADILVNKVK